MQLRKNWPTALCHIPRTGQNYKMERTKHRRSAARGLFGPALIAGFARPHVRTTLPPEEDR